MKNDARFLITYFPVSSGLFDSNSKMLLDYKKGFPAAINFFESKLLNWVNANVDKHCLVMAIPSSDANKVNSITKTCRALACKSPWLIDATDCIHKTSSHASFCKTGKRDAFMLTSTLAIHSDVKGQNVLLLDDVTSTGVSMYVCEKLLLAAGAISVTCLAIAQTYSTHPFAITDNKPDFYIQLKGNNAGRPLREPIPNSIGIVANRSLFVPDYLYYLFMAIYNSGLFKQYIKGSVIPYITNKDISLAMRDWFCKGQS